MAVGPSSNLLSALSQLQGTRPAAPVNRSPQPAASASTSEVKPNSFAAQLGSVGTSIQVADQQQRAPVQAAPQSQSRPIPSRGGLLGQHVNILV
jgi:hypothetical protein